MPEVYFDPALPIFPVCDIDRSLAYYCDTLGFEVLRQDENWSVCICRGGCAILLTADRKSKARMRIWVAVTNVQVLFDEYLVAGARIASPPTNFKWGLEMQIEDLDGNILRLCSEAEA